jgi:hypothetical protein
VLDATDGHEVRTLAEGVGVTNGGIADATGEPMGALFDAEPIGVTRVSADAAGQVLLHVGGDTLQRWHPGDAAPTTIAEDVRDAAWIPKA